MKTQEDIKILLVWNGKRGKFQKVFLQKALQQNVKGEEHWLAEVPTGEWL
jgi:hypothetical protein